jgi:hypothetical protein
MRIGICDGRPRKESLELLKTLTDFEIENEKIIPKDKNMTCFFVKPKDMAFLLLKGTLDVVIGYDDTMYHLPEKNYDLKPIASKKSNTRVCLVKKIGKEITEPISIVSEYQNVVEEKSIFKRISYELNVKEIVNGKAEHYVENDIVDACVTLVETGNSLQRSGLEIVQEIYSLSVGIWVNVDTPIGHDLYVCKCKCKYIYIDGLDGSGKTTLVAKLKADQNYRHYIIKDRSPLTRLTLLPQSEWPRKDTFLGPDDEIWVLDTPLETCISRVFKRSTVDSWEQPSPMSYFHRIYRQLAFHYQLKLITPDILEQIHINLKPIAELKEICRGESKIVYKLDENFELIELIPSIYSHKKQRAGIVNGSDVVRLDMSRNLLNLLAFHGNGIDKCHNWVYIGNFDGFYSKDYVLTRRLDKNQDLPVEVVCKTKLQGSDKYRYTGLEKYLVDNPNYPEPCVRFDWRNPNSHPEGDVCVSERLLGQLGYNCQKAQKLALNVFEVLVRVFKKEMGIQLDDMCFFITRDGTCIYSEISQDNARYKKDGDDYDKDIWRAGGSSELILEKYKLIANHVSDAHAKLLSELNALFK